MNIDLADDNDRIKSGGSAANMSLREYYAGKIIEKLIEQMKGFSYEGCYVDLANGKMEMAIEAAFECAELMINVNEERLDISNERLKSHIAATRKRIAAKKNSITQPNKDIL